MASVSISCPSCSATDGVVRDYNRWRRHSWCGGLSPEQFENKNLA
ncbi:IS1 family transposase [Escherichia coli]